MTCPTIYSDGGGRKSCCIFKRPVRNSCLRKWEWDKLTLGIWARICRFYPCSYARWASTHTHTRREGLFPYIHIWQWCAHSGKISDSLQKALGYKKNHPTSNKPIWDISPIWQSPVLLYSNKLALGFLPRLLLLLFKMRWALLVSKMLPTAVKIRAALW